MGVETLTHRLEPPQVADPALPDCPIVFASQGCVPCRATQAAACVVRACAAVVTRMHVRTS
jgi:hypothetical protein